MGTRRVKVGGSLGESMRNTKSPGLVLPIVKDLLIAKSTEPDPYKSAPYIHPSEMAKSDWCGRATWLRLKGEAPVVEEKFNFGLEGIYEEGNTIHTKYQTWLAETGKLWGNWHCRACKGNVINTLDPDGTFAGPCINANPFHDWDYQEVHMTSGMVRGHADAGLLDPLCLVEIKSIGLGTLRIDAPDYLMKYQHPHPQNKKKQLVDLNGLWRDLNRPLKSHLRQGDTYLWLANSSGLEFDKIVYLYEFKPNQQTKEFTINWDSEAQRRVKPLIDIAERIEYALKSKEDMPCTVSPLGCKQCRAPEAPTTRKVRNVVR